MTKIQKKLLGIIGILFLIILSMVVSFTIAQNIEPNQLNVVYKTLQDEKIPISMNDVSIVYFTDLQYGKYETKKRVDQVFEQIDHLNPDIILFGGDLIDTTCSCSQEDQDYLIKKLSSIKAPLGKFCVLGEKDSAQAEFVQSIYTNAQFEILDNKTLVLSNNTNDSITLSALSNTPDVNALQTSNKQYNLLFTHMPDTLLKEDLSQKNISYALCGHSHGTQITFPVLGAYKTYDGATELNRAHQKKLSFPYTISSGIGCTHTNMRFMAKPEIYYFMLQHK